MKCHSFEPICTPKARVLIVGSMPSVKSLQAAQYYAHPRNAFWPILFAYFGMPLSDDYLCRQMLIRTHALALWDAAACCEREGSLDSQMKAVVYNDFDALYAQCPHIHTVLCNGAAAYRLFLRAGAAGERQVLRLPSTSPAYTLTSEKKQAAWHAALARTLAG